MKGRCTDERPALSRPLHAACIGRVWQSGLTYLGRSADHLETCRVIMSSWASVCYIRHKLFRRTLAQFTLQRPAMDTQASSGLGNVATAIG